MKKFFVIVTIAVSALAVTTSANVSKHQLIINQHSLTDTFPQTDTMNRNNNWNRDTMHHNNMMNDTSRRDTSRTAPPKF